MATADECRDALQRLATRLEESGSRERNFDRTLACTITDLNVGFTGRFVRGRLVDIAAAEPGTSADITITVGSDDLLALVDGTLSVAPAWTRGRLRIDAGMRDMLRLRSLF